MLLSLTYGIPPDELYDRLSAADLADLRIVYDQSPWGPDIDDLRFGMLAATTYHANPFRKSSKRPKDYMIGNPIKQPQDRSEVNRRLKAWAISAQAE